MIFSASAIWASMRGKVPLGITSVDGAKGMGGSGAESSGVEVDDDCGDAGSSPARFSSSVMRALSGRSGCCWIRFNILVVKAATPAGNYFSGTRVIQHFRLKFSSWRAPRSGAREGQDSEVRNEVRRQNKNLFWFPFSDFRLLTPG